MIWRKHQILTPPTDEELIQMTPEEVLSLHKVYHEAIENAEKDPYTYGFRLPHWAKAEEQLHEVNEILALGGNRCLAGHQEIFDPVSGKHYKVKDIPSSFHVWAWDETTSNFVVALACKPFKKTNEEAMLHFKFSDGTKISCTANHRFFCYHRGWIPAASIAFEGRKLVSPDAMELVVVSISQDDYVQEVWDFHVPIYNNYFIGGVLSHNSGKTQWGAFSVVRAAVENPNSEIFCFAQTSEVSIRQQQSAVWSWLPEYLKTKFTSSNAYISYKKKTGFTDSSLILPNGSQIIFKTYSQYQNNPTILEGAELGSRNPVWHNVGVWLDEYLLGVELINTLRFRLATRNSKMLVTFTPIDGWTDVIKEYLDGATTIESRPAELLNGELVPYVQRSKKLNASVHYFHSQDNAFGGYDRIKETLQGRSREEILIRAYGVPMKSHATKFPKFNKVVNVVESDKIPKHNVTRYHIIDPAGSKNWFMCWIAVDETGTMWVYREWPGVDVGDWAEWKGGKWVPGEGAKGQGYGIRDYVELIQEMEGEEEIFERLIDPRLGAAKYQVQDGSSSIIEDLNEIGMVCIPAPGLDIDDGLQALIGKMAWDTSKPLDSVNRPHFYVSSECENIIQALSEYTGEGGLKEAWKDPIDVLRYAAISGIDHVDNSVSFVTTQGSGGY
jgi:hypothetical protein